MRSLTIIATLLLSIFIARGADPTDTSYSFQQCEGSAMPYPVPAESVTLPDSLTAVFINHVGRHGARFPSSPKNVTTLIRELAKADSAKALTRPERSFLPWRSLSARPPATVGAHSTPSGWPNKGV